MPHNMADNRGAMPSFAEKRLYLVSRALKCLSDSVHAQEEANRTLIVSQSNQFAVHSISEHQTSQEPSVSSSHTVKFDIQTSPPITINSYTENPNHWSITSKLKALFLSQPNDSHNSNKVVN